MLFLEEISDELRLPLAMTQVAANASHHVSAVAGAALPEAVGHDVLVEHALHAADEQSAIELAVEHHEGHRFVLPDLTGNRRILRAQPVARTALATHQGHTISPQHA